MANTKIKLLDVRGNRIVAEINKCEKKLKKLLARHAEGKKRWKKNGNKKEPISKLQGIARKSKRHESV